ncbi:hypothetical protein TALK_02885 [Thalassospira alkalitolerans]|uniref:Uncharacterized protein n=1 Tax=Thalassospira alkalitolerans TaxID=1293890 RepID=A0A1Y2LGD7_9PROT|nr:hypothetical protein TALK_02885 [Thalassospira alkalitolerans]
MIFVPSMPVLLRAIILNCRRLAKQDDAVFSAVQNPFSVFKGPWINWFCVIFRFDVPVWLPYANCPSIRSI